MPQARRIFVNFQRKRRFEKNETVFPFIWTKRSCLCLQDQQPDQHQHVHATLEAGEVVQRGLHQLQEIDASQVPAAGEKK